MCHRLSCLSFENLHIFEIASITANTTSETKVSHYFLKNVVVFVVLQRFPMLVMTHEPEANISDLIIDNMMRFPHFSQKNSRQ